MANTIRFIDDTSGEHVYPVTHERGVMDSNGVTLESKLAQINQDLSDIVHSDIIPAEASSSNKLVTQSYVDQSVSTMSATFRGTSAPGLTEQQFLAWADSLTHYINDYVLWDTENQSGDQIYRRYKYDGTQWLFEYEFSDSTADTSDCVKVTPQSFTPSQKTQARSNIGVPEISTNIVTDAASDAKTTSPKAVKTYVDSHGVSFSTVTSQQDGTVVIGLTNGDTITIDLNHDHTQYPKYVLCASEAEYTSIQTKDPATLYLIPETTT